MVITSLPQLTRLTPLYLSTLFFLGIRIESHSSQLALVANADGGALSLRLARIDGALPYSWLQEAGRGDGQPKDRRLKNSYLFFTISFSYQYK